MIYVDFVIPSGSRPKYVIEVKRSLRFSVIHDISSRYLALKEVFHDLTTILISDLKTASLSVIKRAQTSWDYVIDFEQLEKLKDIIER